LNGSADPYDNANFLFSREGETDATEAWLEGCESLGGSASDLGVYGNGVVFIKNCKGFDTQVTGDSGSITEGF
jgi:hypothetical protein